MDRTGNGVHNPGGCAVPNIFQGRLVSVDAYRGFVMFLLMTGGLCQLPAVIFPDSEFWRAVAYQQSHTEWVGCSLRDLVQPGFSFLVGVALVLSLVRREARGEDARTRTGHVINRAVLLILLGLFISSLHHLTFFFDDALTQIGLAFLPLYFIANRSTRDLWIVFGIILVGYWAFFALFPLPDAGFDYARTGVSFDWLAANGLNGFAAHWQKNSNAASAFDLLFLNRLPRDSEFLGNGAGLTTLNFIPLIGTMILGVVAGRVLLTSQEPWAKVKWFTVAGIIGLISGWGLGALGVCPVIKAIWTPSWVLFSGGWCFLFMAAFFVLGQILQLRRLLFPLVVLGMNSIAVYCLVHFQDTLAHNVPERVLGPPAVRFFGTTYAPLVTEAAYLVLFWMFFYLLYRMRIFIRV